MWRRMNFCSLLRNWIRLDSRDFLIRGTSWGCRYPNTKQHGSVMNSTFWHGLRLDHNGQLRKHGWCESTPRAAQFARFALNGPTNWNGECVRPDFIPKLSVIPVPMRGD